MIRPRKKPRPGRLKGEALEALRRACFERDGYRCQAITYPEIGGMRGLRCLRRVTWDGYMKGHMAHIISRARGGKDELSNVLTKCFDCHMVKEHSYGPSGVPPCPDKERTV